MRPPRPQRAQIHRGLVDRNAPLGRRQEPQQHVQQRALAGTRAPHNRQRGTARNGQAHVRECRRCCVGVREAHPLHPHLPRKRQRLRHGHLPLRFRQFVHQVLRHDHVPAHLREVGQNALSGGNRTKTGIGVQPQHREGATAPTGEERQHAGPQHERRLEQRTRNLRQRVRANCQRERLAPRADELVAEIGLATQYGHFPPGPVQLLERAQRGRFHGAGPVRMCGRRAAREPQRAIHKQDQRHARTEYRQRPHHGKHHQQARDDKDLRGHRHRRIHRRPRHGCVFAHLANQLRGVPSGVPGERRRQMRIQQAAGQIVPDLAAHARPYPQQHQQGHNAEQVKHPHPHGSRDAARLRAGAQERRHRLQPAGHRYGLRAGQQSDERQHRSPAQPLQDGRAQRQRQQEGGQTPLSGRQKPIPPGYITRQSFANVHAAFVSVVSEKGRRSPR